MQKIIAIIPARGGSKLLKNKNIKKLFGKPLICYSIEIAKKCKFIDRVIVSSDSKKIIKIAKIIVLAKNTPKALGGLANICCTRTFLDFLELGLCQNNTTIIPIMANNANS